MKNLVQISILFARKWKPAPRAGELGEVMTEDQFKGFDKDGDGSLNIEEIRGFVGKFMVRFHITECIKQMDLEIQLPHKIVNLLSYSLINMMS